MAPGEKQSTRVTITKQASVDCDRNSPHRRGCRMSAMGSRGGDPELGPGVTAHCLLSLVRWHLSQEKCPSPGWKISVPAPLAETVLSARQGCRTGGEQVPEEAHQRQWWRRP